MIKRAIFWFCPWKYIIEELQDIKKLIVWQGQQMHEGFKHLTDAVAALVDEISVAVDVITEKANATGDDELEAVASNLDAAKKSLSDAVDAVSASSVPTDTPDTPSE